MTDSRQTRNVFLVLAAFIANVYLAVFLADAAFSVFEELFRAATGSEAFLSARTAIALMAALLSLVLIPILVLVPHLPKRVFVPLILFALWASFGAPPLNLAEAGFLLSFALVLLQLALALFAFRLVKRQTGQMWLSAKLFPTLSWVGLRIAASAVVVILGLLYLLPVLALLGLGNTVEQQTAGYVRFTDVGVEVADRTFRKGDQTVRLIGMVHVGEAEFYSDLFSSFPDGALVLAEGVSDKKGVLEGNLSYKRVAQILGLDQQPALRPAGMEMEEITDGSSAPPSASRAVGAGSEDGQNRNDRSQAATGPDIVSADVDISDFSETTIEFLNETAELYDSPSLSVALERLQAISGRYPESAMDVVMADIVDKRDAYLLAEFDRLSDDYNAVIMPWGAMHMPGIESGILDRGYILESERFLPLIRYETLIERLQAWRARAGS